MARKIRNQITDGIASRKVGRVVEIDAQMDKLKAERDILKDSLGERYGAGNYATSNGVFDISVIPSSQTLDGAKVKTFHPEIWHACQKDKAGYTRVAVKA